MTGLNGDDVICTGIKCRFQMPEVGHTLAVIGEVGVDAYLAIASLAAGVPETIVRVC